MVGLNALLALFALAPAAGIAEAQPRRDPPVRIITAEEAAGCKLVTSFESRSPIGDLGVALKVAYLNSRQAEDAGANAIVKGPGKEVLDPASTYYFVHRTIFAYRCPD